VTPDESTLTLKEVGERRIVEEITRLLEVPDVLLDGYGHDAAFVDLRLAKDEILVINTDRSGINLGFKLGLAGAECVGDFGVSHAVSDVVAAGGRPKVLTVALLLPPDTTIDFVRKVMKGAQKAASRYGAVVVGGDTKQNPKFAMVVTAIGAARRDLRLTRSNVKKGDAFVVTGFLGTMFLGTLAHKNRITLPESEQKILDHSLVHQVPPFQLGRAISDAGIAHACIDISDGLSGALYSLCSASNVGAAIDESMLPVNTELGEVIALFGQGPMQLSLAGGDWQYLYAIPRDKIAQAHAIAERTGASISVIGYAVEPGIMAVKTEDGYRHLYRIEHDSFADEQGKGHFESMGTPSECFGPFIDEQLMNDALSFLNE
jgi:thiamine-monophosphate kinase